MIFLDRILEMIGGKGITRNKMLTDLGINHNAFAKWKKPNCVPNGETLCKLADYFDVSVDYLLCRDSLVASAISPDEIQLIKYYRLLNEDNQKKAIGQVHDLTKVAEYRKDTEIAEETHVDAGKRAM